MCGHHADAETLTYKLANWADLWGQLQSRNYVSKISRPEPPPKAASRVRVHCFSNVEQKTVIWDVKIIKW